MSKIFELETQVLIPFPVDPNFLNVEMYGARSKREWESKMAGEAIVITCPKKRAEMDVQDFAAKHSGHSDWIVETSFLRKDGLWVWVLIR